MTKKRSKSCTYHLRSSKATKRQNSKPHSASSVYRSSSSDNKKYNSTEPHCIFAGQETILATSSKHSHDAREKLVEIVDSSAAVHLASTLNCTLGKESVSLHLSNKQRQMERSRSSSYTKSFATQNERKQRAHSIIPVLPIHSSIAQSSTLSGSKNQREDVLSAFCTSALWSSVDHPNYGRLNNEMKKQQYKLEYSFYPPIQSNNHLSTITITSRSFDKMTYPPPPPPEIDPAATSASYNAYPTSGNLSSGYAVDENGHHVQHLPPLSEALHPDDAAAGASADHLSGQNAHYGAHAANVYDPHHTGTTTDGSAAHGHYDQQQSNNFFDPQIMEPPPPADGSQNHHTGLHGNGASANGNNGYGGNSAIMTPPPPASSHGYASSPYQSGGSAPLFHRASISGPVMHSHYPPPPGNQSATHGADVWSSTSATARPHTADGMFAASQMGGMPGQWASVSEYNRGPRGSVSSMSDAAPTSGSSKVFSYMPSNGDDSSSTAGSQGHPSSGGPRKRPRRRYDEIERLYSCSWPGCQKSYGTLNHLNAHVAMQKHGPKRSPAEFKDMRKAWRKSKREDEQRRQANAAAANEEALTRSKMAFAQPNQPFMTHTNYPVNNFMPPPTSAQNNANALGGAGGNGQVPRYHPQSGMYSGYSAVHNGSYAGGAQGQGAGSGGLGAYLMAHRGSI